MAEQKKNGGNGKRLDVSALESWLWDAACEIRGPVVRRQLHFPFDDNYTSRRSG